MAVPKTLETRLEGLVLIEPTRHGDDRGFLVETYRGTDWAEVGINGGFVQDNHSRSTKGVLRGMHFQTAPGQAKLVRCSWGAIFDVAVDIRPDSPTFGEWEGYEISERNGRQFYIPAGFAHGFCVLTDQADVMYKLSSYYDPETESGFAWNDPEVGIEWPISDPQISERDASASLLSELGL